MISNAYSFVISRNVYYNNGTLCVWEEFLIYHSVIVVIKIFCMNGDSENLIKSKEIKKVSVR